MLFGWLDCFVDEWKWEVKKEWMINCWSFCCFWLLIESVWIVFFFDLWFVFYIWNMVFYFFVCIFFWSLVLVFLGCGCYSCWCSLKLKRLVVYFDLLFVWNEFFFFLISLIFFEVLYFLYYLFGRFFVYEMSWNLDFLRLVLLNGLK